MGGYSLSFKNLEIQMEMRSINFSSQLLFAPTDRLDAAGVGDRGVALYSEISRRGFALDTVTHGQGALVRVEKKLSEGYRRVAVQPDRLEVEEEWAESTVEEFEKFFLEGAAAFMKTFGAKIFVVQTCVVRALVPCPANSDARDFLAFHTARIPVENLKGFGVAPGRVGLMFSWHQEAAAPASQRMVRLESFGREKNQIFVENHSIFTEPFTATNLAACGRNLVSTRDFIANEVARFLTASGI